MTLCRQRLLYDDSEAYRLGMVMYRRKTLSPFAGQIDHDSELARLRRDLITVYSHIKDRSEPESWYVDAVERAPLDAYLNVRYGEYLLSQGRLGEAHPALSGGSHRSAVQPGRPGGLGPRRWPPAEWKTKRLTFSRRVTFRMP